MMRVKDLIEELKLIDRNPKVKSFGLDLKLKKKKDKKDSFPWVKSISYYPPENYVVFGIWEGVSVGNHTDSVYSPRVIMTYRKGVVWYDFYSITVCYKDPVYWCHLNLPENLRLPRNWPERG